MALEPLELLAKREESFCLPTLVRVEDLIRLWINLSTALKLIAHKLWGACPEQLFMIIAKIEQCIKLKLSFLLILSFF